MYSTDPFNTTMPLTPQQEALVLGGELCAWDDAVTSDAGDVLVDITPYLYAVAETWWSPTSVTHQPPDQNRLHMARCRLVARGVPSHPVYGYGAYCAFEYAAPAPAWGVGAQGV
jgi:hexosaminidase